MPQKFELAASWSDPQFGQKVKLSEFIDDIVPTFHRRLTNFSTVNDVGVITLDADIPDSDGLGDLPAFDVNHYGLIRR